MTTVLIALAILLGIAFLCGIWYNGRKFGQREVQAETTQVGADTQKAHVEQLQKAREQENEAAVEKDVEDAKNVNGNAHDALGQLVRAYKDGGSKGPGSGSAGAL